MTRLVLLHGFTQTGGSWRTFRTMLSGFETVAPDLPGHGTSPDGRRNLWEASSDIIRASGPGVYVGYSFGARLALHCALSHPGVPTGLVLISGTAGIEDADERAERRSADESLADHICEVGIDAFLDEWLAQPLFTGLDESAADRASRISNSPAGLADSLRFCGTGTQEPLWSRLSEIDVPVLVVAGSNDEKFRRLGERLAASIADSAPPAGATPRSASPKRRFSRPVRSSLRGG